MHRGSPCRRPRRLSMCCAIFWIAAVYSTTILLSFVSKFKYEKESIKRISVLENKVTFLENNCNLKHQNDYTREVARAVQLAYNGTDPDEWTLTPDVQTLIRNITGTRAAAGVLTNHIDKLRVPFIYHLLPHLMEDVDSLKPAYHMTAGRELMDLVIGVPTVRRDKENYYLATVAALIAAMTDENYCTTLIIVMVGETNLEYVIDVATEIELEFPKQVADGLIEVISPAASYYPEFADLPVTLGDSIKRSKWRTKQNLDTIYLMAYAYSKGVLYLMLEDDVIAQPNYIQEIKEFTATLRNHSPPWFFIDYSHIGAIGKLFRSIDLVRFINYVELFYYNMPIDWLLESYLADLACSIDKLQPECAIAKDAIRPRYKKTLFEHIGRYSSLNGKILQVPGEGTAFFSHSNPPARIETNMREYLDHTFVRAYNGHDFFWAMKPKVGSYVAIWFLKPVNISRFTFRSANYNHIMDKLVNGVIEVLPEKLIDDGDYSSVGRFDEFGVAEGVVKKGPIASMRLRITKDCKYWIVISEIRIQIRKVETSVRD